MKESRIHGGGLLRLVLVLTGLTLLVACGASPPRDADRIHSEPTVEARYQAWVDDGEPEQPTPDGKSHWLVGEASWYGPGLHGNTTANGESFDMYGMTAAHKTLPFNTVVRVRRPDTGQFVVVRINDRGPYAKGRIIDLSYGAAHDLGIESRGVAQVELDVVAWGR